MSMQDAINNALGNNKPRMEVMKEQDWQYYPSREALDAMYPSNIPDDAIQIKPGQIWRTDGMPTKDLQELLVNTKKSFDMLDKDDEDYEQAFALLQRMVSVSDLTPAVYDWFNENPDDISNWLPQLDTAVKKQSFFKTPNTAFAVLTPELSQFMRIEYQDTNKLSRDLFNKIVAKELHLDADKEYFIKTGTFSSKFEFRNAHCIEPLEAGEYFQVINNFAMQVGSGWSNTIVAREWIPDVENRPTIYNGMPLRTEFRFFVDFDKNMVIDGVPYWNPLVMNRSLQMNVDPHDFDVYQSMSNQLTEEFNEAVPTLTKKLQTMIGDIDLTGRYSIDVMKNGDDYYIIDMAQMEHSALTELIAPEKLVIANA